MTEPTNFRPKASEAQIRAVVADLIALLNGRRGDPSFWSRELKAVFNRHWVRTDEDRMEALRLLAADRPLMMENPYGPCMRLEEASLYWVTRNQSYIREAWRHEI